jgi:hypothetical protein
MLSLENNGGFSTFRSGDLKLDLSSHLGLLLRAARTQRLPLRVRGIAGVR